jgi:hypothetical protein
MTVTYQSAQAATPPSATQIKTTQDGAAHVQHVNIDNIYSPTDDVTGAIETIDYPHHEAHEGNLFLVWHKADVTGGGTMTILVKVPAGVTAHTIFSVITESETDLGLYEGPTVSNDGTSLTAYNHKRSSTDTGDVTAFHTPTVSVNGTQIDGRHWGSGRGVGGEGRSSEEWLLAPSTNYLVIMTNATAQNNYISFWANWYEK